MLPTLAWFAGLQLLASNACAQTVTFSADSAVAIDIDATGEQGANPRVENRASASASGVVIITGSGGASRELERQDLIPVGSFIRTCKCTDAKTVKVDDIRGISDEFCADGNAESAAGLSNMVWSFGQFLDHDLALTIEDEDNGTHEVETDTHVMELHRAVTRRKRGCRNSLNAHSHRIDAGPIYGSRNAYLQHTLREPGTCYLRHADGDFLPITTRADDSGSFFFIAGDVRVSEHAFLAAQHTVWLREHNRLCDVINADKKNRRKSSSQKFDIVKRIVTAKFQQVVLEEFLPALGITQKDLEDAKAITTGRGVSAEFSIAYRLGHDLIGNKVGTIDIANTFNAESFYLERTGPDSAPKVTYKASANDDLADMMHQLASTKANEIDGKLSDALRNFLFGHDEGQDLAGRNIFRGRELGMPTYAGLAECFGTKHDATVESETPDAWLGLLREPKAPGEVLPPTLRAIIVEQFHRSFFGRGGFYWKSPKHLRRIRSYENEIADSTYAKIISANTKASVSGNVFKA
eukprot:jgi/Ulvmu1/3848/UM018_0064.1